MRKQYVLFLVVLLFGLEAANAQFNNVYTFDTTAYPYGSVTVAGNKLFGVAYEGGVNGQGFLFELNRNGTGFKDIWNCYDSGATGNANGAYPYGNLTYMNGRLYGFAYEGGANDEGLIFSIDTAGHGYKDLYDLESSTGIFLGWGSLTVSGNKFYGMTYEGGANNYGAIFSIDTSGGGYRDVFDFNGTNGAYPEDVQLAVYQNKLYGMTFDGGINDSGVIFSIDTSGAGYKDLYDLNKSNGYYPEGHLTLVGNKLYGMTQYGGLHDSGVVFSTDTGGGGYKNLYSLDKTSGFYPWGSVIFARGELYGMTYKGGVNNYGNMFSIDTSGMRYNDFFDFNGNNGYLPYGNNFTLSNDTLFGMTYAGGAKGDGNIFYYVDDSITLGLNPIQAAQGSVSVYPNPNGGQFTVALGNAELVSALQPMVEIYNVMGKKVYTEALKQVQGNNIINIGSQANGVYLYRIVTINGTLIKEGKLVLEK